MRKFSTHICLQFIVILFFFGQIEVARAGVIFDAVSAVDGLKFDGYKFDLGIKTELSGGDVEKYELGGRLGFGYRISDHVVYAAGVGGFARAEGSTYDREHLQHLRYRYYGNRFFALEAFAQQAYAEPQRTQIRALFGAGPRLQLLAKPAGGMAIGMLPMFEYFKIVDDAELDAGVVARELRASNYLALNWNVAKNVEAAAITYVQPRLDKFRDYRLSQSTGLAFIVNDYFKFETRGGVAFDKSPPLATKRLDWEVTFGVGLKFSGPKKPASPVACVPATAPVAASAPAEAGPTGQQ